MKTFLPAVLALVVLSAGQAWADPSSVQVGDIRAVLPQGGVTLQPAAQKPLPPGQSRLAYGTLVRVEEVQGYWMRVTAAQGGTGSGWLLRGATIEPRLLSSNGVRVEALAGAGSATSSRLGSAAGRELVESRVSGSNRNLVPAYPQLNVLEAQNRAVDLARVESFVVQGRLGRAAR